jgi:RimJ/RimL family protein N-acetyltransferase
LILLTGIYDLNEIIITMLIPADLSLETSQVLLRPLDEKDFDLFYHLTSQDKDMWYYFSLDLSNNIHLKKWIDGLLADKKNETRRPFTIIHKQTGNIAGSMSLMNISIPDKRLEIGASWLGKDFRSTGINKHAKFAMMRYAFEQLHFERVEFKTDTENLRARKGLKNIGGTEEGILRSHMAMWNGRRRSSVYYSVLKNEWLAVKEQFFKGIE